MARPKEFNTDAALNQALDVFWEKGFEATSLTDLTGAMGISKSSFYETFGSKHDLFLATMQRYKETTMSMVIDILKGQAPARQAIAQVFDYIIKTAVEDGDRRGCFLANCIVESGGQHPQISKGATEGLERIEDAFLIAVKRGQATGDISKHHGARALARFLSSGIAGIRIAAKAGAGRRHLEDIAGILMAALD